MYGINVVNFLLFLVTTVLWLVALSPASANRYLTRHVTTFGLRILLGFFVEKSLTGGLIINCWPDCTFVLCGNISTFLVSVARLRGVHYSSQLQGQAVQLTLSILLLHRLTELFPVS